MRVSVNQWRTMTKSRSKYGAKKVKVGDKRFDSIAEGSYYQYLCLLQKSGQITDIQLQVPFELQPKYVRKGKTVQAIKYFADFVVTYADGHTEVVDVKGMRTDVYKLKKKMLLFKYPDMRFIEICGNTRVEC